MGKVKTGPCMAGFGTRAPRSPRAVTGVGCTSGCDEVYEDLSVIKDAEP
jgi:hypothetical protein